MDENITRRTFLSSAGRTILTAGCATYGITACAVTRTYRGAAQDGRFAGVLADYPELSGQSGVIILEAEGLPGPIVIINVDGSDLRAFSAVCAHQGCTVGVSQNFLLCPCHGSTYTLQGEVVRGPAQRGLKQYPLEIHNGSFSIDIRE